MSSKKKSEWVNDEIKPNSGFYMNTDKPYMVRGPELGEKQKPSSFK